MEKVVNLVFLLGINCAGKGSIIERLKLDKEYKKKFDCIHASMVAAQVLAEIDKKEAAAITSHAFASAQGQLYIVEGMQKEIVKVIEEHSKKYGNDGLHIFIDGWPREISQVQLVVEQNNLDMESYRFKFGPSLNFNKLSKKYYEIPSYVNLYAPFDVINKRSKERLICEKCSRNCITMPDNLVKCTNCHNVGKLRNTFHINKELFDLRSQQALEVEHELNRYGINPLITLNTSLTSPEKGARVILDLYL
jgi:hypothetical protein